jgi:hypothetical protein
MILPRSSQAASLPLNAPSRSGQDGPLCAISGGLSPGPIYCRGRVAHAPVLDLPKTVHKKKDELFAILPQQVLDDEVWEFTREETVAVEIYPAEGGELLKAIAFS